MADSFDWFHWRDEADKTKSIEKMDKVKGLDLFLKKTQDWYNLLNSKELKPTFEDIVKNWDKISDESVLKMKSFIVKEVSRYGSVLDINTMKLSGWTQNWDYVLKVDWTDISVFNEWLESMNPREKVKPNIKIQEMADRFVESAPSFVKVLQADEQNITIKTVDPSLATRWTSRWIGTSFDSKLWEIKLTTDKNDPFTKMEWVSTSIKNLGLSKEALVTLSNARFNIDNSRQIANIESSNDKWLLIPTVDWSGFATICKGGTVNIYDKDNPIPSFWVARKPVIYLYPKETSKISVSIKLNNAKFTSTYPKISNWNWTVLSTSKSKITNLADNKKYSYLFWEAEKEWWFELDIEKSHCIANKEICSYLEKSLKTLGLNTKESNDFMVYWLPILEKNPFSVIEWKTTEYTDMAKLDIVPKPDTIIRVFMVFKKSDKDIKTWNPKILKNKRKWFSVIEWGWCNLDENNKIR